MDTTQSNRKAVAITGCDNYLGQAIAHYLLRESERNSGGKRNCEIRVLASNESECKQLKELGARVYEVRYEDRETLKEPLRNVECVILIPEMTHQRIRAGENVIEVAEREQACHLLMLSCIGVDKVENDSSFRQLEQFRKLERMLEDKLSRTQHCIFRLSIFQQLFFFWTPMIEEHHELRMPLGNHKFSPLNLNDVGYAIYTCMARRGGQRLGNQSQGIVGAAMGMVGMGANAGNAGNNTGACNNQDWPAPWDRNHHKRVYEFTGPNSMSGHEIAECLNRALGERKITYRDSSREDLKQYLEKLRHDDRYRQLCEQDEAACMEPSSCGMKGDSCNMNMNMNMNLPSGGMSGSGGNMGSMSGGRGSSGRRGDYIHGRPNPRYLNEVKIECILELFELAKRGKADFTSDDLEKVVGSDFEPERLDEFFQNHREEFLGRRK